MGSDKEQQLGVALDIGTTNVVLNLYDLNKGELILNEEFKNPQIKVAADVMGRIAGAMKGRLREEQELILKSIGEVISGSGYGANIERWVVTGNTTMLYLLTGRNPSCLSAFPFEADCLFDYSIPVLNGEAYLPKCLGAFVGADITCGILYTGMCEGMGTGLLVDIGTNAEMALWKDGILYTTSAAAGPAFERKKYKGSQMVDIISDMLRDGTIDMYGTYTTEDDSMVPDFGESISLSQADIRSVQLAKGAVAAGIKVLMEETNTSFDEIEEVFIGGVFGEHLNLENAGHIGLIPKELVSTKNAGKVKVAGNIALKGAAKILLEDIKGDDPKFSFLSKNKSILLAEHGKFNSYFIDEMNFDV